MKFLVPTIFIVISGVVFFGFIDTKYNEISDLRNEAKLFEDALDNSKELQNVRDDLLAQYNALPTEDLERLEKILPNNVDNVRLVRDIDGIATNYGMSLRNVNVDVRDRTGGIDSGISMIGSVDLSFSVTGSYAEFTSFLRDLERSLRVVDVINLSFAASEKNLYEYKLTIRTYWLK